ncbi:hypothetical protein [Pedobacter sp. SL55]|uniref:hypothetical protein n=1 Tax=Pedobacter sp. SL55 TaxID=2995161 RepID=UPI00226D64D8|nr:hypothetical protein [Pedobacter sp. SL55]WAC42570.1 hypothetical protein OVA16_09510 [Pedobacter sp. SL55]
MKNKTILLLFYLTVSALMLLNVCLYTSAKMSFAGYWSDRVIFWIWLLATPVVVICFWKIIWTKIYFWLLLTGLILSVLPMALPFFGIFLSGTGRGRLNHFSIENNIRVQTVAYGIMGRPRLQIVKDGLLFDKVLLEDVDEVNKNDSTWLEFRNAANAKFISQSDTSITIKYFFEKDTLQTEHVLKEKTSFNY